MRSTPQPLKRQTHLRCRRESRPSSAQNRKEKRRQEVVRGCYIAAALPVQLEPFDLIIPWNAMRIGHMGGIISSVKISRRGNNPIIAICAIRKQSFSAASTCLDFTGCYVVKRQHKRNTTRLHTAHIVSPHIHTPPPLPTPPSRRICGPTRLQISVCTLTSDARDTAYSVYMPPRVAASPIGDLKERRGAAAARTT